MSGGRVPGTGNRDTVPRTLDAGAFVLRKAAVRKYGGGVLSRLANGVARFAGGGLAAYTDGDEREREKPKKNREAVEALKTIDLGLQGMEAYLGWVQRNFPGTMTFGSAWEAEANQARQAEADRQAIGAFIGRKELTTHERGILEAIKTRWQHGMSQPLLWGEDLERELIDYLAAHEGELYRQGGVAASDRVPALLTPGEYVVNKSAVARYGAGFFAAINALALPAQALAERVQGFAAGGPVLPAFGLARPLLPDSTPVRTVRVELAAGNRQVVAAIDQRDETALLQLLEAARTSAA
jgi:hypothetical protein